MWWRQRDIVLPSSTARASRQTLPPKHELVELQSQSWPPVSISMCARPSATRVPDTMIQSTNSCACRERAGTRVLCMKLARTEIVEPLVLLLAFLAHAHIAGVVLHEDPLTSIRARGHPAALELDVLAGPRSSLSAVVLADALQLWRHHHNIHAVG